MSKKEKEMLAKQEKQIRQEKLRKEIAESLSTTQDLSSSKSHKQPRKREPGSHIGISLL